MYLYDLELSGCYYLTQGHEFNINHLSVHIDNMSFLSISQTQR